MNYPFKYRKIYLNTRHNHQISDLLFQSGIGAIHMAAREGHTDIVTYLIQQGADINTSSVVSRVLCLLYYLLCFVCL